MDSYVYMWTNTVNGKRYIGKGRARRARFHLNAALRGSDTCPALYRAIRKYGVGAFELGYIATGLSDETARKTEVAFISMYGTKGEYNLTDGGDGAAGAVRSDAQRARHRQGWTPELRAQGAQKSRESWSRPETRASILSVLHGDAARSKAKESIIANHAPRLRAIADLFDGHTTLADFAESQGVTTNALRPYLTEAGWYTSGYGRWTKWLRVSKESP